MVILFDINLTYCLKVRRLFVVISTEYLVLSRHNMQVSSWRAKCKCFCQKSTSRETAIPNAEQRRISSTILRSPIFEILFPPDQAPLYRDPEF